MKSDLLVQPEFYELLLKINALCLKQILCQSSAFPMWKQILAERNPVSEKKNGIPIRRIIVGGVSYTIRPSFVMPYHVAFSDDAEKPLFLRKFNVPFWALAHVFGKYAMYWYRIEQSLGRNSIVGTTIRNPDLLPEHLAADEKHSGLKGNKLRVSTTVGDQCILGASISEDAGESGLKNAYGRFREEAPDLNPEYSPKSVK